jgi:hypothetical protein
MAEAFFSAEKNGINILSVLSFFKQQKPPQKH